MLRSLSAVIAPPKYTNSIVWLYTRPAGLIANPAFGLQAHDICFHLGDRKLERRARGHDRRHHPPALLMIAIRCPHLRRNAACERFRALSVQLSVCKMTSVNVSLGFAAQGGSRLKFSTSSRY